jgi:hypothetical protein
MNARESTPIYGKVLLDVMSHMTKIAYHTVITLSTLLFHTNNGHEGKPTPHAYGPGALLGAWARPAPTPNKPLAGHLVATLPPEPPPLLPALTSIQL